MKNFRIISMTTLLVVVSGFFLYGCKNYLSPAQGAVALEKSRIDLPEAGLQESTWKGKDMDIQYSISRAGDQLSILGKITIHDSVIMSYPRMSRLVVKMNFLDGAGVVIGGANISPSYSAFYEVDRPLSFKTVIVSAQGTRSFAFNYYGNFTGMPHEPGENLEIFYFPFE